jgi:hypothetical protein
VLGVFLLEAEADDSYLDVIHPEEVPEIRPAEITVAPEGKLETLTPQDVVRGEGVLTLLASEAQPYFRIGSVPNTIEYAMRGPFLPGQTTPELAGESFGPAQVNITRLDPQADGQQLPPLHWSGLRPLSSFRLGPFSQGRHHVSVLLELPVCNIMEWYNVAEDRLWVDSPDSLVSKLRDVMSEQHSVALAWRSWLDDFELRTCPSDSYFVFLLPREWGKHIPDCDIVDAGIIPLWEDSGRSDVRAFGRYNSNDPFRLEVNPKGKLIGRKLHYQQTMAAT